MGLQIYWKKDEDGLNLLSEPYLSYVKNEIELSDGIYLYPRLYFSYDAVTLQTTFLTTELNQAHIRIIQRLKELSESSMQPKEIVARLLIQWFDGILEEFRRIAEYWNSTAVNLVGSVKTLLPIR